MPSFRPAKPASADPVDRRFARQLTQWLDAGGPSPEAFAVSGVTADALPSTSSLTFTDAWALSRARDQAIAAVRKHAKGKDLGQISDLLRAEYDRRGIDIDPSNVAVAAELLQLEQLPFGRIRAAARAADADLIGGDLTRIISNDHGNDPSLCVCPNAQATPSPQVGDDSARSKWINASLDGSPRPLTMRIVDEAYPSTLMYGSLAKTTPVDRSSRSYRCAACWHGSRRRCRCVRVRVKERRAPRRRPFRNRHPYPAR